MSSTNRSNARDFHIADYYVTPKNSVRKFMLEFIDNELFPTYWTNWMDSIKILDPCAWWNPEKKFDVSIEEWDEYKSMKKDLEKVADIVIFKWDKFECIQKEKDMSYPKVLEEWGMKVLSNDLREDSPAMYHSDFLKATQENIYDLVITNPPFAIAQEIIEKSLQVCKGWWYVVMLLRLNYIGSNDRAKFWQKYPPYAIYADNKRMSFTPDKGTDSIEYAHFVWKKWESPENAKFYILT